MAEPTITQVFGANSSQTSTQLIISISDLVAVGGLTSGASSYTAESILAALLVQAQAYLTSSNQSSNSDQSIVITDSSNDVLTYRNSVTYRRKTKSITFDKLDTGSTFNPNDY